MNYGSTHPEFTHYHPRSERWFTLDKCENCGGDVQQANAVKVSVDQLPQLRRLGVIIVEKLPAEGYWSNITEGETCGNCDPDLWDNPPHHRVQS
jgi:hypothetical protein